MNVPSFQNAQDMSQFDRLDAKKREALRLLESLDTQALVRLSNKLETRGLCSAARPPFLQPVMPLNLAGATADPYSAGAANPPMAPGMPSPLDYIMGLSNPAMVPGALAPGALPPGALPVGALPAGLVRPGATTLQPTLQSLVAAGYANGSGFDGSAFPQPPPPPAPTGQWNPHYNDFMGGDEVASPDGSWKGDGKTDDSQATTLILRNLPATFAQDTAQSWLDEHGYSGKYDFFLWFPAKSTSRLNSCGYAFVNFRSPADAVHCSKRLHLMQFPNNVEDGSESLALSVAVAKVQGFAENYARFQHLLEATTATRCAPFFGHDSIEALSQAELKAAVENAASNPPHPYSDISGPVTTIVIRNLPSVIESTDIARQWLDSESFARQYDFLLYLPAKRQRDRRLGFKSAQAVSPQGYGYAFVNFKQPEDAEKCIDKLNGKTFADGSPALNIVTAKVQGAEQCVLHFNSLADSGRCTPWLESGEKLDPRAPIAPRTVFQ